MGHPNSEATNTFPSSRTLTKSKCRRISITRIYSLIPHIFYLKPKADRPSAVSEFALILTTWNILIEFYSDSGRKFGFPIEIPFVFYPPDLINRVYSADEKQYQRPNNKDFI